MQAAMAGLDQRIAVMERRGGEGDSDKPPGSPKTQRGRDGDARERRHHRNVDPVTDEMRRLGIASSSEDESSVISSGSTSSEDSDRETRRRQRSRKGKGKSKKSGRAKTTEDFIVRDIPWPHYGVYKGSKHKPADYDELSLPEFVYGYMDLVLRNNTISSSIRRRMLHHLQDLMEDAMNYPWPNVRNFHGVLLGEMERDLLKWKDRDAIQRLRAKHSQTRRSDGPSQASSSSSSARSNAPAKLPSGTEPCEAYQRGACPHEDDHSSARGTLKHVCAYCWRARKKLYVHPERDCWCKHGRQAPKE